MVTIGDLHTFEFAVRSKMTIAQIKYGIADAWDADKLHVQMLCDCVHVCVCMCVCVHVCVHMCVCVHVCVCMHVH